MITVHGDFARADKCDRDFHKIAESFGMQKEFQELKETTDYNELPLTQRHKYMFLIILGSSQDLNMKHKVEKRTI